MKSLVGNFPENFVTVVEGRFFATTLLAAYLARSTSSLFFEDAAFIPRKTHPTPPATRIRTIQSQASRLPRPGPGVKNSVRRAIRFLLVPGCFQVVASECRRPASQRAGPVPRSEP